MHRHDDMWLERNRELVRLGGREDAVATDRHKKYIDIVEGLARLLRELFISKGTEIHEGHPLKFDGVHRISSFALTFRKAIIAFGEEALHAYPLAFVFPRACDREGLLVAIGNLFDAVHVRVVTRDERNVGAEFYCGQCA